MFKHFFEPDELSALHYVFEVSMQSVRAETARYGVKQTSAVLSRAVIKMAKAGQLEQGPLANYAAYCARMELDLRSAE
jgi:hypothetical protein